MMFSSAQRAFGLAARRAAVPAAAAGRAAALRPQPAVFARMQQPLVRPFSVLGRQWGFQAQRLAAQQAQPTVAAATSATKAQPEVAKQIASSVTRAAAEAPSAVDTVRSNGMVFEIGFTFLFTHYISIFQGFVRCLFQSFRPLLILFVFGQILKAVFFMAGAPIWLSFYSVWLFEVIYGLAQCALSFIFISFFYNNLSFARMRPALARAARQHRETLARAAQAIRF